MTQYTVLPTTDSLRSLMADTHRIAGQVLMSYVTQLEQDPGNQLLKEIAESIRRLNIELTFREASFAKFFPEPAPPSTDLPYRATSMPLKTYSGFNDHGVNNVTVTTFTKDGSVTRWLDPRHDLIKHSPKDLQWGGAKPRNSRQLSLAILADFAGDDYALAHYEAFNTVVLQHLPHHGWTITADQLAGWTKDHPMPRCQEREDTSPQLSLINV